MKKVITGHNADGKAIFVKEEPEEVTIGSPIVDWHEIWATHADDTIPIDVSDKKSNLHIMLLQSFLKKRKRSGRQENQTCIKCFYTRNPRGNR